MVDLRFTLAPLAALRVHDILVCLSRFSETVSIEATSTRFALTALNASKSAYASFSLDGSGFFSKYECIPSPETAENRFTCRMYCKALLSVFKSRIVDPRGRENPIDRCEVNLQDRPDQTEHRFIINMISNEGVTKTYKLTYESVEVMHALFDKNTATNRWRIQSYYLKDFIQYFAAKTEQLDVYAEEGRVTFASYTEKISNGREILKHPMRTAVSANLSDFEEFNAQEKLHIIINVKDFRAIVTHADTLKVSISAYYSQPTRPLQLCYGADGVYCEFTLMTTGDRNYIPAPSQTRTVSRAQSTASMRTEGSFSRSEMPPPVVPASRTSTRRLGQTSSAKRATSPKSTDQASETLFVSQDEDDTRWDPADQRDNEETLGWDSNADNDTGFHPTFRDSGTLTRTEAVDGEEEAIAPTQRLSQIKGLW